jgi:hypothetical protein
MAKVLLHRSHQDRLLFIQVALIHDHPVVSPENGSLKPDIAAI